jgi:hypothetical protein
MLVDQEKKKTIAQFPGGKKLAIFPIYLFPDVAFLSPDVSLDVVEALF